MFKRGFSLCGHQVFSYTANKEIRTDDLCLDVSRLNGPVMMLKCHHLKGNQLWEYDPVVSGATPIYAVRRVKDESTRRIAE